MKTNTTIFSLVLLSVIILSGCAQQQTKYVCPDGTTVSDSSYCQRQESNPVDTKPTGPSCGDGICNGNEKAPDCDDCEINIRIENLRYELLKPAGQFKEFYISNYDVVQLGDKATLYPGYDLYAGYSQQQCTSKGMMSKIKEDFDCPGGCYFVVDSDKRGMSHKYFDNNPGFQIGTPENGDPNCIYFVFHLKPYPESGIRMGMNPEPIARYESGIIQV